MKRGPKPKGKTQIEWSPHFAYVIGLIVADGCLSKDGRHIDFTSKDRELVALFNACLKRKTKISRKNSGRSMGAVYHSQFSDVLFYQFLVSIGLSPAKSKTLSEIFIADVYFFDFLRGYFDGDGSSYSYFDPHYKQSYRFYISFTSASPLFIKWLREKLFSLVSINGYISRNRNNPYLQLKFAKKESIILAKKIYYKKDLPCLRRKYLKIMQSMRIIGFPPGW